MIAVSQSAATGEDVLLVKRRGLGPVEPLIVTKAGEKNGTPSPDGKSFVYSSDKNGRRELFLRPYGAESPEVTVSPQGGDEPVWSHDGRELFYRGTTERGGRLMAGCASSRGVCRSSVSALSSSRSPVSSRRRRIRTMMCRRMVGRSRSCRGMS